MISKTIILAAGGTGGHLYPAEALAQELLERGHKVIIVTDKRGTAFKRLGDKAQILCVRAATFKPGLISKIVAVRDILLGIIQSAVLIKKIKPAVVIGFGGYPSYPTMFAAQRRDIEFRTNVIRRTRQSQPAPCRQGGSDRRLAARYARS